VFKVHKLIFHILEKRQGEETEKNKKCLAVIIIIIITVSTWQQVWVLWDGDFSSSNLNNYLSAHSFWTFSILDKKFKDDMINSCYFLLLVFHWMKSKRMPFMYPICKSKLMRFGVGERIWHISS